jgi:2-polyprenyl-3-methyl-5-hydroxy-6-metoxy-1,4-benzoquinol methylase
MGRKLNILPQILSYQSWRHRIHLGNGVYTPGYNTLENDWEFYHMPENVKGKSVLDLGANDGYYSFTAENKGAESVTATDIYWGDGSTMVGGWPIQGITLLKEYFNSNVEIVPLSVYDLPQLGRKWDIVLCNDLLSWLDDIPKALKIVAESCSEQLIIHDTFSTDNNHKGIDIKQMGIAKLHRMHISYLKKALVELGFKKIKVKKVYTYKHYEWQDNNLSKATSNGKVNVLFSPFDKQPTAQAEFINEWVLTDLGDYIFVRNIGWILRKDINVTIKKKTIFKKIIKNLLPHSLFNFWHSFRQVEKSTSEFVVQAKR